MAQFDNVNYTFYSSTLGRSVVPDEASFNLYKTENILFVKNLVADGLVFEREENGIDSAVCMTCEVDYKASLIESGKADNAVASESLGAYSYSTGGKVFDSFVDKNAKSVAEQKMKWLRLYCDYVPGVR